MCFFSGGRGRGGVGVSGGGASQGFEGKVCSGAIQPPEGAGGRVEGLTPLRRSATEKRAGPDCRLPADGCAVAVAVCAPCCGRVVEDEEEGGGVPPTSPQEDLGWDASAPDVAGVVVPEGAVLQQAGTISSLLEGMVVVTGLENSRALDMG